MRWKLLSVASLLAALAGAGGSVGLFYLLTGSPAPAGPGGLFATLALLFPVATITYASIFVYRHTARRRKTQAAVTALLSLSLTLAVLFASTLLSVCCAPAPPPAPAPTPRGAV